jgi:phosphoribosylanthranilate isomerase
MRVKVCGVTRVEDAELAVELGADLVGLNLWPGSPRALDLPRARAIAAAVRGRVLLVGVFVDQGADAVARALDELGLDLVQLHGDEAAGDYAPLVPRAVKAFRLGERFEPEVAAPFDRCWGFLLDAARPGAYGGTGEPWSWEAIAGALPGRRLLLAGGIDPGRVRDLAARWRERAPAGELPWGIDVCSGVESAPGVKDPARLRALLAEVRDVEIAHVA